MTDGVEKNGKGEEPRFTERFPEERATERFDEPRATARFEEAAPGESPRQAPAGTLSPGETVDGRYRVEEGPIGDASGEAVVYRCTDLESGGDVALKHYHDKMAPKQAVVELLLSIRHRDVVAIRGWGAWGGRAYEVMDYCAGGSLAEFMPFDEEALAQYRENVREKEGAAWVQERVRDANDLLSNLSRREQTLLSVAQCIAETQEDFLREGEGGLKPLRMADVAARVGIHESTVSRTVNGKYVQTPQGVLELKRFFSVGLATDDGEDLSARAVRAQIRALIEKEDKSAPLSDEALSEILQKEQGIRVARRTVAKYREGMGIPTKRERKRFS